jgi:hypothetical protein
MRSCGCSSAVYTAKLAGEPEYGCGRRPDAHACVSHGKRVPDTGTCLRAPLKKLQNPSSSRSLRTKRFRSLMLSSSTSIWSCEIPP